MPFTLAHPIAVIPIYRYLKRYSNLSALIIGSVTPDLAYIFPSIIKIPHTHNLFALLWFCIPVGMLSYVIFHCFLKAPFVDILPDAIFYRVTSFMRENHLSTLVEWIKMIFSIFCGALTHSTWDSFTHIDGPAVEAWPLLKVRLFSLGGYSVYIYKLLQHTSTAVGLLLIIWLMYRWLRRTSPSNSFSRRLSSSSRSFLISMMLTIPTIVGIYAGMEATASQEGMLALQVFMGHLVFSALPILAIVVVSYCVVWQLRSFFLT